MDTKAKSLLIVDDDKDIRDLTGQFLIQQGYSVTTLPHGENLLTELESQQYDLLILDILLPGVDGFELCKQVRKVCEIPIIMLTAINESMEKIIGLEIGADDYLTKPFNPRELLARIKVILRRVTTTTSTNEEIKAKVEKSVLSFAGWTLNLATRQLLNAEQSEVIISAGEYDLLVALLEHPQRVISRDMLLDFTRNRAAGPFDRSIDVQISRLRQKLDDDPKAPKLIKTIRNGGYMFSAPVKKQ